MRYLKICYEIPSDFTDAKVGNPKYLGDLYFLIGSESIVQNC